MINISNLSKKYNGNLALNNINLDVEKGNVYGLVGENGAGKTTLINCITNVITNYQGRIISKINNELIGFMPQDAVLDEDLSPEKLLLFFYLLKYKDEKEGLKKVNNALKITGCHEFKDRKIKTLSHGMKRRIMIAQAIMNDPSLVILDEPTSGLDPKIIIGIRDIIIELKNKGKTLFISSHNTEDIEEVCDYLIFLDNGIIKKQEKIDQYRGSNLIKIMLKNKISNKDIELLKQIRNISDIKERNNELLIYVKDNKLTKETINNILSHDVDFVNIRMGREIEDIFK